MAKVYPIRPVRTIKFQGKKYAVKCGCTHNWMEDVDRNHVESAVEPVLLWEIEESEKDLSLFSNTGDYCAKCNHTFWITTAKK